MEGLDELVEKISDAVVRKLDERRKIDLIADAVLEKIRERNSLEVEKLGGIGDEGEGRKETGRDEAS